MGKGKAFFKPRNIIRTFVLLSVLLNTAYISFEIYKSKISSLMGGKTELTQSEFEKFHTLSNFSNFFEVAFLYVSIIWIILMIAKKYNPLFIQSFLIQVSLLIFLFILNYTLAILFNAPTGNLTQLLFAPLIFAVCALIYAVLHHLFSRIRRSYHLEN